MSRTYSPQTTSEARIHLQELLDAVGDPNQYRAVMTRLGNDLGGLLATRLPPGRPLVLLCTVEDADCLAQGVLDVLSASSPEREVSLACFWNERATIGSERVAHILRRYVEPFPAEKPAVAVLKSIISGACVVRTNLLEILDGLPGGPAEIFVVAPVLYAKAPQRLAAGFPSAWAERFDYLFLAEDDHRKRDGTVLPGIGGNVYTLLGWSGQDDKNRHRPRLVQRRNERFLLPSPSA